MYDEHFRFGVRRAQMLLACVEVLDEFWKSTEEERLAFTPRFIENRSQRLRIVAMAQMHPNFEHSTGLIVDRPWLRIKALPPDTEHIGLGMIKCRAVCAVKGDLMLWLKSNGASVPEASHQIVLGAAEAEQTPA